MQLMGDILRGHTDSIILSILSKGDSYGYRINQMIEELSDHRLLLTEATLYTAFKRLEKNGLITSYWREGSNNVPRKYYTITQDGRSMLAEEVCNWQNLESTLNKFLQ